MDIRRLTIGNYEINEEIIYRKVSDETVMAYNPENGDMYELNDVSEEIIFMLRKRMSGDSMLVELSSTYDVDEQTIVEDVSPLLDRLIELGLLTLK